MIYNTSKHLPLLKLFLNLRNFFYKYWAFSFFLAENKQTLSKSSSVSFFFKEITSFENLKKRKEENNNNFEQRTFANKQKIKKKEKRRG